MADDQAAAEPQVANSVRGELSVTLEGVSYRLRPTMEAMEAVEEQLGAVMALALRAVREPASLRLHDVAVIITETMRGAGQQASLKAIKQQVHAAGIHTFTELVALLLMRFVNGGAEDRPGNG